MKDPQIDMLSARIAHVQELMVQRLDQQRIALDLQAKEYERRLEVLNNDREEARNKESSFVLKTQYDIQISEIEKRLSTLNGFASQLMVLPTRIDGLYTWRDDIAKKTTELAALPSQRAADQATIKELADRVRSVESKIGNVFAWGVGFGFAITVLTFVLNYVRK